MIIDWRGRNYPAGELEDAIGRRRGKGHDLPDGRREFRVDTETGEVTSFVYPYEIVVEEDGEERLATITEYLTPPITVWLYL